MEILFLFLFTILFLEYEKCINMIIKKHIFFNILEKWSKMATIYGRISKVRDLGVIFDHTAICRSTHFHIRNIGKIRNLLLYDACSTIIHALISCQLDYCNYIMYNVPKSKTDRLQRLQNQCARILTKSPRMEHITPVLKKKCSCLHINHITILVRMVLTLSLSVHSFMLLHANGTN